MVRRNVTRPMPVNHSFQMAMEAFTAIVAALPDRARPVRLERCRWCGWALLGVATNEVDVWFQDYKLVYEWWTEDGTFTGKPITDPLRICPAVDHNGKPLLAAVGIDLSGPPKRVNCAKIECSCGEVHKFHSR
ncbi:MAG: hypothetical protein JNM18_25160 [Planctomycetaceae bacterium]|nr:hypothetical protein [Planctomycetaceae bacterium]